MLWWERETWVTQSIGFFLIVLRIIARTKTVGIRGWKGDDYIIWTTIVFCVADLLLVHDLCKGVQIGLSGSPVPTEQDIQLLSRTLRDNFVLWYAYVHFLWSLKACMLFLYWRLTTGLSARRLVIFTAWFCGISYIVMVLYLGLHCTPVQRNWQVRPNPGPKCNTIARRINFFLVGILNIVTDLLLVSIPLPLLWRARVPLQRKLIFGFLLCSGFLIVIVAVIRNVSCLVETNWHQGASTKTLGLSIAWANREQFIAIVVVNAPCIKPLFSGKTWFCHHASDALPESDSDHDPEIGLRRNHHRHNDRKGQQSTASTLSVSLKRYISGGSKTPLGSTMTTRHSPSQSQTLTQISIGEDSEMEEIRGESRDVRSRAPTPVPMLLASFSSLSPGLEEKDKILGKEKVRSMPSSPRSAHIRNSYQYLQNDSLNSTTPSHTTTISNGDIDNSNTTGKHRHSRAHSHSGHPFRRPSLRRGSRHLRSLRHSLGSAELLGSNRGGANASTVNVPLAIHTTRTVDVVSDVATERDVERERWRNMMSMAPFRFEGEAYISDSGRHVHVEEWELRTDVSGGGKSGGIA